MRYEAPLWNEESMWKKIASLVIIAGSLIIFSSAVSGGEDFLSPSEYWKRPIPLQISNSNSELPLSFHPEDCGECHKEQYKGWKESLHSRAVGPGLLSQIDPHNDSETAVSCYYCHAPMMEQSEVKTGARGKGQVTTLKTNSLITNLSFQESVVVFVI
ncbi:MAG: hypothetical protein HY096_14525 [Nitrospinae bacterium]|nr:hypothetical protein [Nitrospinota bacterium]